MSLINPTLLLALPLAIIPVVLHLLLRSKPKRMHFPALRLIQSRRKSNTRRFRLKQFWLMLLRIVVIGFFILLLTRPSLPAANYTPNLYESVTTLGLALIAFAVCWGLKRQWERRELPRHQIAYRQTVTRSLAGLIATVLFILLVVGPYAYRLRAELTGPRPIVSENIPSAAIFLFDVSLSMEYRSESDTRLDVARKIANQHLDQLPSGSRVAIATNQNQSPILFQIDKTTARELMFKQELSPSTVKLNARIWDALPFRNRIASASEPSRERQKGNRRSLHPRNLSLYGLSRNAWDLAEQEYLKGELKRLEYVQLYVIDVSKEDPKNLSLSNIQLKKQEFLENQPVTMSVSVRAERQAGLERQVELYTANSQGEMIRQAVEEVSPEPGTSRPVELSFTPQMLNPDARRTNQPEVIQGEILTQLNRRDDL
ncbi:MAG: BatA domain-containing protein [Planctomycetaceae bacterium]